MPAVGRVCGIQGPDKLCWPVRDALKGSGWQSLFVEVEGELLVFQAASVGNVAGNNWLAQNVMRAGCGSTGG